jgi:hypothetical protein
LWALTCLKESRWQLALAGFMAIMAALTRSVGVSVLAAVLVLWLLRRRWVPALVFLLASGLTVGAWLYWTSIAPNQIVQRSYAAVVTTTGRHFMGPVGMVLTRTKNFVLVYLGRGLGSGSEVPTVEGTSVDNVFWIAVLVGLGLVGFYAMRKKAPIVPLYFLAYCGVLLLYPYKMTRFFVPAVPILLLGAFVGLATLGRRMGERTRLLALLTLSLTLLISSAPKAIRNSTNLEHCDRSQALTSRACFSDDRLAFFAAAKYAAEHLPRGSVVTTIKEATFFYYTGHPVLNADLAMAKGKDQLLPYLRSHGVDYVMVSSFVGGAEVVRPLLPVCGQVELVQDFGSRTLLLRLHDSAQGVTHNACAVLTAIKEQLTEEEKRSREDDDISL